MLGTDRLVEEHNQLSHAWLEAEQGRVEILERLIKEHGGKSPWTTRRTSSKGTTRLWPRLRRPAASMSNGWRSRDFPPAKFPAP